MIPWLLVASLLSQRETRLSDLVAERVAAFPCSGEINRQIKDPAAALQRAEDTYAADALTVDHTDGLSVEYENWRFNLRKSNTEPVVRLNVEARGSESLMKEKTAELIALMEQ